MIQRRIDWQDNLRDALREQATKQKKRGEGEQPPERLADFGFTYPVDYIQRSVRFLERWGVLPETGGWADQDSALIDDIETLSTLMERAEWEAEHEENTDYSETETDVQTLSLGDL